MTPQMQNLLNVMQGFSSAEILMALMMMSAGGSDDKKANKSNDSMSMLLGFAMAGQINQIMGDLLASIPGLAPAGGAQAAGMGGLGGMVGGMLNVQA